MGAFRNVRPPAPMGPQTGMTQGTPMLGAMPMGGGGGGAMGSIGQALGQAIAARPPTPMDMGQPGMPPVSPMSHDPTMQQSAPNMGMSPGVMTPPPANIGGPMVAQDRGMTMPRPMRQGINRRFNRDNY